MDKIERVARALCEACGKNPDETYQAGNIEALRTGNGGNTRMRPAVL